MHAEFKTTKRQTAVYKTLHRRAEGCVLISIKLALMIDVQERGVQGGLAPSPHVVHAVLLLASVCALIITYEIQNAETILFKIALEILLHNEQGFKFEYEYNGAI